MVNLVNVQEKVNKADDKDARKVVNAAEDVLVKLTRKVNFIESHGGMSVDEKLEALKNLANGTAKEKAPMALGGSTGVSDDVKERLANFAAATNTDIDKAIALMLDVFEPIAALTDQNEATARVIAAGKVIAGTAGFEVKDGGKLDIAEKHDALVNELESERTAATGFENRLRNFAGLEQALSEQFHPNGVPAAAYNGLEEIVNSGLRFEDILRELDDQAAAVKDIASRVKPSRLVNGGDVLKVRVNDLEPETQQVLENARSSS